MKMSLYFIQKCAQQSSQCKWSQHLLLYSLVNIKQSSMFQLYITFCLANLLDLGVTSGLLILHLYTELRPCKCHKMDMNLQVHKQI